MSASVTHFEIYAEGLPGLAKFYRELFDWKIEQAPGIDYFRIQTGDVKNPGIAGGMLHRPIQGTTELGSLCARVDSIDQTIERIEKLGGKMIYPKTAVPKAAWYAVVEDPEGNIFSVYQPDPLAMPMPEPEA